MARELFETSVRFKLKDLMEVWMLDARALFRAKVRVERAIADNNWDRAIKEMEAVAEYSREIKISRAALRAALVMINGQTNGRAYRAFERMRNVVFWMLAASDKKANRAVHRLTHDFDAALVVRYIIGENFNDYR